MELSLGCKTSCCSLWYSLAALALGVWDGRGAAPLHLSPTEDQSATLSDHWHHVSQRRQMWPLSLTGSCLNRKPSHRSRRGGGWSKGLWLLGICIEVRSPAANNLTRLRNDGETSLVHSSFHLKQKVLFECKLRSSTLDTPLSQTYSQKINNLSFPEIG